MALAAGDRLGPYEILSPIGAGGMGEVYKARDTRLDRIVAIKVLPAHVQSQPEARQRFEREARAVSALNHPHICNLYDVGRQDGVDFLVMEHLEGESLDVALQRGPLPVREALKLAVQIAGALGQAHAQGVVHRDLKPANVMVTRAGAKLLDFGLAKLQEAPRAASEASQATLTHALTTAGTILGTFQYMPPEQLEGKEADARSDIFSFGAVLFEMLTGRKAFQGGSQASLIAAVMSQDPPAVSATQPGVPAALDRIVQRCLAKHPDDRWQSALDLAGELRWIAEGGSQTGAPAVASAPPARAAKTPWLVAAAGWGLLIAALVPAIRYWTAAPPKPAPVRFELAPPPGQSFEFWSLPAISPDGSRIALDPQDADAKYRIWIRSRNSAVAQPVPGTEMGWAPFWSPDGSKLGFSLTNRLMTVDLAGGTPQEVVAMDQRGLQWASWGSQGDFLYVYRAGLWTVRPGAAPRKVFELAPGETAHGWPEFLPDGKKFLYMSLRGDGRRVMAGSLDSTVRKEIVAADFNARFVPPGRLLFVKDGRLLAQSFDPATLTLQGAAAPLADAGAVGAMIGASGSAFAASPDLLLWRIGDTRLTRELLIRDRNGKILETVGAPGDFTNPALSPDGRLLAVCRRESALDNRDIWIYDLVRGNQTRFTTDPADDFNPVWSADGRRIAFTSNRRKERDLYVRAADRSGQDEVVYAAPGGQKNLEAWSPDGKYLVYNFNQGRAPEIWAVPLEGERRPVPVVRNESRTDQAQISPDGRWVAFSSSESGSMEVYVSRFSPGAPGGGRVQISNGWGTQATWRADGRELYYIGRGKLWAVEVKTKGDTFDPGIPKALMDAPSFLPGRSLYVPFPDGQRFVFIAAKQEAVRPPFQVLVNWTSLLKD